MITASPSTKKVRANDFKRLAIPIDATRVIYRFCDACTQQIKELKKHYHSCVEQAKSKIIKLDNEKAKLIEAFKQGIPADDHFPAQSLQT